MCTASCLIEHEGLLGFDLAKIIENFLILGKIFNRFYECLRSRRIGQCVLSIVTTTQYLGCTCILHQNLTVMM